ncbi:MAG: AsmA family protein [Myxococcales bacterium]|nr:AsmA family protein [Myxococcales bacterium]
MLKKLFRIGLVLFAIFVVAVVGLVIAVRVMYPPAKVRALVEAQVSKALKRDVQLKGASLTVFPVFGVQVEGLRISNTSRSSTIEAPTTMWKFLASQNLKKPFVQVVLNGKALEDVVTEDRPLKKGDVLKIERTGFRNKEALFSLGKLSIAVKVMPLLSRKVEIKKIVLDRLQVLVEVDPRGSFNFDDLSAPADPNKKPEKPKKKADAPKKAEAPSQPISLRLDAFEIKDSTIVYHNRKTQQEVILEDINQTLSASFDTTMTNVVSKGLFEIKRIALRGRGLPVRKSGLYFSMKHDVKVAMKAGNLDIKQFTVGFQKTYITIAGSVNGYDKKVRHLNLSIKTNKIQLQDLFKEVPPAMFPQARKMSVKGGAQLAVTIKGKIDAKNPSALPSVNGLFQIMDGRFKYADLPKAINQLNADIRFTEDSLDMKKFAFNLGTNPVSLMAKVNHFKKPVVDVALKADVDLGSLKDAVKLPKGVSVQGKIKADVTAKGKVEPKNPEAIDVKGQVAFVQIVATTPAVKKPVQVNGTFKFSNQEISLEELTSKIGKSSFTMDMKIRDYLSLALPKKVREKTTAVTYSMNAPLLDLNEMLGQSKGTSKPGPAPKKAKASASSSSSSSTGDEPINIPKLPNVTFDGKIRVAKLIYKTLPIEDGKIDLSYRQGKVKFVLKAGLFEGRIIEDLDLDISNPKRIRMNNRFDCVKVEANDFISNFNDIPNNDGGLFSRLKSMDNKVYGKMDLVSKLKSHGITSNQLKNNLSGSIIAKLYKGHIKNASILEDMTTSVPKLVRKFLPKLSDIKTRKVIQTKMTVKDGKVHVTDLSIPTRQFSLAGYGTISLGGGVNMKMDIALSKAISRKILYQQKRLQRAAGGFAKKIAGGALAGYADKLTGKLQLIPSNKKGQIVPIVGALGLASKLAYKFMGFQGGPTADSGSGGPAGDIGKQAKKMVTEQIDKAKKMAMQKAEEAKKMAMKKAEEAKKMAMKKADELKKQAMKNADAARKKAEQQARDATKRAQQQAAKKKKEVEDQAKKALQDKLKW